MIYLDSAATSLHRPREVKEAVCLALDTFGNSGRGSHDAVFDASRTVFRARKALSAFFGVEDPSRVAFTANATQSLNMAIEGLFQKGDHVITTCLEHNSVLRPLYRLEERGAALTILPCDEKGNLCYETLETSLRENTRGVVCTHASNLTGNLVDIDRIGSFCRERGILFVLDCAQTAGVYPVDMKRQKVDVLCFTGHKGLLGPQGTGGLCIRPGLELEPFFVGGSGVHSYDRSHPAQMPERLEAGTLNSHGIAGLLAGVQWLERTGVEKIRRREQALMRRFYKGISDIPEVEIYGDLETEERTAVVTINLRRKKEGVEALGEKCWESGYVADLLAREYGIAVRGGAHCAPLMHEALGTGETGAVRFSFGYFNTEQEIDRAICAVKRLARELSRTL